MQRDLSEAAHKLLDVLDVLDADTAAACEDAVEAAVKSMARRHAVEAQDLWDAAREVERDPVERHRHLLGPGWRPILR
jgi:hypothetical protein